MPEFREFPKIPRLFRDVVITEKLDGTNAAIGIEKFQFGFHVGGVDDEGICHDIPKGCTYVMGDITDDGFPYDEYLIWAQSRSRIITAEDDNYGFALWVFVNAITLVKDLGEGLHFGEWWGSGIQRGYGLKEKRFSLFNVKRLRDYEFKTPGVSSVPVLSEGPFDTALIGNIIAKLATDGSVAAPGFMRPEGIVVYHTAGNVLFKATIEKDEEHKGGK